MQTPLRRFLSDFFESKVATAAVAVFAIILFIAIFAPWISPQNPYDLMVVDVMDSRMPPGEKSLTGMTFVLGSDGAGRDMLSAIFYGLRTSLGVGVMSGIIALGIGMAVGLAAAYFGGRTDTLIMRVVDLQLSFPAILIALILLSILGKGVDKIIIALVIAQWAYYARTVRGSALVERSKEYIEAATCLALSHRRIVFRHLLPNVLPPLIVVGTLQTAHAISLEATLSFLGVGLPQTEPSLGLLISNGFEYMLSGKYWISFFPGVALLITIVSINLVGDQLRDVLNPRLER
ncbi:MAG: ABC transporter permease subunit [Gammaproteobacteria bacterium]|nr:ABC transporter permease subunit [Gammaproteobacteria bacterium]NIM74632.1 ABC transporter permease subunit [Gammaproteobacteria bacterium]NIO26465.1 ABC transporter permease subunit [Gammaproteobacteria bacterium]NIO67017.1 ABC transporter permease subunit [Gammaproteobacteria bacterium]NIP46784.1 ABC transporter permease [Gammaproteobacteria bacterium]